MKEIDLAQYMNDQREFMSKQPPIRSKALRDFARGQPCTMQYMPGIVCSGGGEDTCLRHANMNGFGKGMGLKAHDIFAFYGCQNCEDWYSMRRSDVPEYIELNEKDEWIRLMRSSYLMLAISKTQIIAVNAGIIVVQGHETK